MTASVTPLPRLVSIMLMLPNEMGHPYAYNLAVRRAVQQLGWQHQAAVEVRCTIKTLPPDWEICLHPIQYVPSPWRRAPIPVWGSVGQAALSIKRYLYRLLSKTVQPTILFLEFFAFPHLLAFTMGIGGLPATLRRQVWALLVYRFEVHQQRSRVIYQGLHRWLTSLVGQQRLLLTTDSDLLAAALQPLFRHPLFTLPIPHTDLVTPTPIAYTPRLGRRLCWWPGRPAPEKGLAIIQRLAASQSAEAQRLILAINEDSPLPVVAGGPEIIRLSNVLFSSEYASWMQAADLILLPYDDQAYATRTSGIFVEAIAHGKPVAVTEGTWMAYELRQHGLTEMIVDWKSPAWLEHVAQLANHGQARPALQAMQAYYQHLHNEASYGQALEAVWQAARSTTIHHA